MIILVTTKTHQYTHNCVVKSVREFRLMSYAVLLSRRWLPRATYIFGDFDRLGFFQLELAAHAYRRLAANGCRCLNDPARALQRLALLRRLKQLDINSFNAWPVADFREVDRFPVFIRTMSAHRGNLTELIWDAQQLSDEIEGQIALGYPSSDLMIVEYRAEPMANDVFKKLSAFRIGDRIVGVPSVHERHWAAKYGELNAAGEKGYAEDLAIIENGPYNRTIMAAFKAGDIEYGRADYGLVNGRPEIYEINTNPSVFPVSSHPSDDRVKAMQVSNDRYKDAMRAIDDTPRGKGLVEVRPAKTFEAAGRLFRLFPGYHWVP